MTKPKRSPRPPKDRGQGRKPKIGSISQIYIRAETDDEATRIAALSPRDRVLAMLSQASRLGGTPLQWEFILYHLSPADAMAGLIQMAESDGVTFDGWLAARRTSDRMDELTASLSQQNLYALTIGLPMMIGADSLDVETFVADHWRQPVTNDNFAEVGFAFKRWYKENFPGEYNDPSMAMFQVFPGE